jgi:hypothetical protein
MNRSLDFNMMTNHRLPESIGQRPELSESTEHSSKSLFSTLIVNQVNSIPGDNMDKIMVLVYYKNPDHNVAGLSNSTQRYLAILLYRLARNNQSWF